MKHIIIILSLLLLGCVTQKRCLKKFPPQVSVVENIVYRDTIVYVNIPGQTSTDSVFIEVEVPLNVLPFRVNTEYCLAVAWVQNSMLKLDVTQIAIEKEIIFKDVIVEKEIIKEVVKEVNKLTRWQEFKGWLGLAFLIFIAVYAFVKLN